MGFDRIIWTLVEHRDAACSVPFVEKRGKITAPRLILKGTSGSTFGKKEYDVKPDNFAKMRCYGKRDLKDPKIRGKDIHCVGIDMNGNPIATEMLPKSSKGQFNAVESVSNVEWNNEVVRSTKLAKACLAAITGERQITPISFDESTETS